jgi:uncharacterized protein (TIGR03435 family)
MNAAIHVAGWTLVHFVWQGTLIGLAAAVALHLLRQSVPQARYGVACWALAAMIVLPGATAWRLWSAPTDVAVPIARVQRRVYLRVSPEPAARHDRIIIGRQHTIGAPASGGGVPTSREPRVLPTFVTLWFAGVCLLLVRLAGGWWRVRRLQRTGHALAPSRWQHVSNRLARQLGLSRLVHVVDATFVDSPMVIGWLRPVVLLPVAAVAGRTPDQIAAILAHVLAHVLRHDALVNFAQTIAETLLFYHPAVWWISSRIRSEREHCCDDVALSISGDAYAYASALAELESWRAAQPTLALAATGGPLLRRVARVLAPPAAPAPRGGVTLTLALALVLVVGAGALQFLAARQPLPPSAERDSAPAWRMVFDHPSGQMTIRGFTARDLVRYAYQLPTSQVVGGPAWLDSDSFDLTTTVDHVPAADETPAIVRQLLEERFSLRVHEAVTDVPALALEIARADGVLGPNLQPATGACVHQEDWVAAGAPHRGPLPQGPQCGVWDSGVASDRVLSVTMDDVAARLSHQATAGPRLDVINRTGLQGPFDLSLDYFKPAALAMTARPSLRSTLRLAGFQSIEDALESQLGLKLTPTTTQVPAIAIDGIQRPLPEFAGR